MSDGREARIPNAGGISLVGERILITLWVGALWAIGYLAVPTLFATLQDRMLAGMLAGKMFTAVSYIGLVCGVLLLLGEWSRRAIQVLRSPRAWLLVGMLLLVAVGQFWLQPMMEALKTQPLVDGTPRMAAFMRLHGIAAILYLCNSVGGLLLAAGFGLR